MQSVQTADHNPQKMLLRIRDKSSGSPITSVTVNPLSLVSAIHRLILDKTNIDEDCELSLYYRGRLLDPDHPISRYNIHGNAYLDLVVMEPEEEPPTSGIECSVPVYCNQQFTEIHFS